MLVDFRVDFSGGHLAPPPHFWPSRFTEIDGVQTEALGMPKLNRAELEDFDRSSSETRPIDRVHSSEMLSPPRVASGPSTSAEAPDGLQVHPE